MTHLYLVLCATRKMNLHGYVWVNTRCFNFKVIRIHALTFFCDSCEVMYDAFDLLHLLSVSIICVHEYSETKGDNVYKSYPEMKDDKARKLLF